MSIFNFKVCSVAVILVRSVNIVLKETWELNPVLFCIEGPRENSEKVSLCLQNN